MLIRFIIISMLLCASTICFTGCGMLGSVGQSALNAVGLNEEGTVISKSAYIRSSYAVVAADLLEVKRGQMVDILGEAEFEKVLWYRVAAHDDESTEGWIEAQHIIKGDALDRSKELAEESKELQSQAVGQLRAPSNLRITAGQEDGNILLLLDGQATFDIVDWEYRAKVKTTEDEAAAAESEDVKAAKEGEAKQDKIDDKYDVWYLVRLDPSVSPAPMGWVYGKQVDLRVPGDIVYYQSNNRKFVAWQSLDSNRVTNEAAPNQDTDVKVSKPGSWVILSRTNEVKAIDGVEPDYDGVLVMGFDNYNEEHYTVFSTSREGMDVWGMIPLKVEGSGDNHSFTLNLRNFKTNKVEEKKFVVFRDAKKRLRVTAPDDIANYEQKTKQDD